MIRAFGIVPWPIDATTSETGPVARHRKSLLYQGSNVQALKMLVSGLQGYIESFKKEKEGKWFETSLSNVTSLHRIGLDRPKIVKVYDYRTREVGAEDRRLPNLELVRRHIDPHAELLEPETDLHIVVTTFLERPKDDGYKHWFDPVPAFRLGEILEKLHLLHQENYVHGDIRLLNTVPHAGVLVDFDITRKEGQLYPSTLQSLPNDGTRAAEVKEAISDGSIGQLRMRKTHDRESMLHVLKLFEPKSQENTAFTNWWNEKVRDCNPSREMFNLVDAIKAFKEVDCLVGLKSNINVQEPYRRNPLSRRES